MNFFSQSVLFCFVEFLGCLKVFAAVRTINVLENFKLKYWFSEIKIKESNSLHIFVLKSSPRAEEKNAGVFTLNLPQLWNQLPNFVFMALRAVLAVSCGVWHRHKGSKTCRSCELPIPKWIGIVLRLEANGHLGFRGLRCKVLTLGLYGLCLCYSIYYGAVFQETAWAHCPFERGGVVFILQQWLSG